VHSSLTPHHLLNWSSDRLSHLSLPHRFQHSSRLHFLLARHIAIHPTRLPGIVAVSSCQREKKITCDLISISATCNANADFIPVASGGDGSDVQFCKLHFYLEHFRRLTSIRLGYVGFSPTQETVIVAHQGTDTSEMHAKRYSWKSSIA
jgi:hypothetical protein